MPRTLEHNPAPNWNWSPWWKDCWSPNGGLTQLSITSDLTLKVFNPATGRFRTKPFISFEMFGQGRQQVDDFQASQNHRNYADDDIFDRAWHFIEEYERFYGPAIRLTEEPIPEPVQPGWLMTLWAKLAQLFNR